MTARTRHGVAILGDALLSVIVAPTCRVCDTLLDHPTAGPVCDACWSAIQRFTPPLCHVCGDPLPVGHLAVLAGTDPMTPLAAVAAWVGGTSPPLANAWPAAASCAPAASDGQSCAPAPLSRVEHPGAAAPARPDHLSVCARCRHAPSDVAASRAIGEYAAALRAIIHVLKYDKRSSIAPRLSALMRASAGDVLRGADAVVPVPLHWRREWQRGFNQAALLASGLGVPVWRALVRLRATRSQVDLPAHARRVNVRDAFAIARRRWPWQIPWRARLEGAVLLLVDDVSTTGSTLEACAKVLRESGAQEVRALTAARVAGRAMSRDAR